MSGKKGRSGRKPAAATLERLSLQENEERVPEYIQVLKDIAGDSNTPTSIRANAYQYLVNRSEGSPKVAYDLRFTSGNKIWTADDYQRETELLHSVVVRQGHLIEGMGECVPESPGEMNKVLPIENIWIDIDINQAEVDFGGDFGRQVV